MLLNPSLDERDAATSRSTRGKLGNCEADPQIPMDLRSSLASSFGTGLSFWGITTPLESTLSFSEEDVGLWSLPGGYPGGVWVLGCTPSGEQFAKNGGDEKVATLWGRAAEPKHLKKCSHRFPEREVAREKGWSCPEVAKRRTFLGSLLGQRCEHHRDWKPTS